MTYSPASDADLFNVGVAVSLARTGSVSLEAAYDFTTGASTKDHLFSLQAKMEF